MSGMQIHIHMYIHTYIHTYTQTHTYIHTNTHTHTHIHTYIHACMHACIIDVSFCDGETGGVCFFLGVPLSMGLFYYPLRTHTYVTSLARPIERGFSDC